MILKLFYVFQSSIIYSRIWKGGFCIIKTKELEKKDMISKWFVDNQKKLYFVAISITKNHFLAEDALQDSYLKIIQKYHQLKKTELVKQWITRIVTNQCKDILKSNKIISVEESELEFPENLNNEELYFYDTIKSLPLEEKEIITLKYLCKYEFNEIAEVLKIPISTVKSKLYRALEKIKEEWSD